MSYREISVQMRGELIVDRRCELREEDESLWSAAVAGDASAFETLVDRYSSTVTSIAAALLGNREDVEDAYQETFLRAFERLPTLRNPAGLRTWLIRIAVNVCRNKRRGCGRWRAFFSRHAWGLLPTPADPGKDAELRLAWGELMHAVQQLPENLRVPFILRFSEGLTGPEIAAILGWSESTVWTRIYAARRELRKRLDADDVL